MTRRVTAVGVVVVNYRSAVLLSRLLGRWSDEGLDQSHAVTVVVVDNDVGDLERDALGPNVEYVAGSGNPGYAAGVNAGCRVLQMPYVLLLNPDADIGLDAVEQMAAVLDENPVTGAVAPLHCNRADEITNVYRRIPSWLDLISHRTRVQKFGWARTRVRRYLYTDLAGIDPGWPLTPAEQPPASCLLVRRSAVVGEMMDVRFPILFNDVDLSRRLACHGWPTVVAPWIACRHVPATSTRYLGDRATAESHVGAYRYVRKWEGRGRAEALRISLIGDLMLDSRSRDSDASRIAAQALRANHSIFDGHLAGDPVRPYWPDGA
jgi:hypothetical protein